MALLPAPQSSALRRAALPNQNESEWHYGCYVGWIHLDFALTPRPDRKAAPRLLRMATKTIRSNEHVLSHSGISSVMIQEGWGQLAGGRMTRRHSSIC